MKPFFNVGWMHANGDGGCGRRCCRCGATDALIHTSKDGSSGDASVTQPPLIPPSCIHLLQVVGCLLRCAKLEREVELL